MTTIDGARRDDRDDLDVILHRLMMHAGALQAHSDTWMARHATHAEPRVRASVEPAQAAARAVAALAAEAVRVLGEQASQYDIERAALLPGDEIRAWPSGGAS